jgi:hypothetical protein
MRSLALPVTSEVDLHKHCHLEGDIFVGFVQVVFVLIFVHVYLCRVFIVTLIKRHNFKVCHIDGAQLEKLKKLVCLKGWLNTGGTSIRWLSKTSCNEESEQALIMQLLVGGYIDKARTKKGVRSTEKEPRINQKQKNQKGTRSQTKGKIESPQEPKNGGLR